MSKHGKTIFNLPGATHIPLYSGEVLLIGRPHVFGSEFRQMIEQDKPGFTERVILNIQTYASHGAGRLHGAECQNGLRQWPSGQPCAGIFTLTC